MLAYQKAIWPTILYLSPCKMFSSIALLEPFYVSFVHKSQSYVNIVPLLDCASRVYIQHVARVNDSEYITAIKKRRWSLDKSSQPSLVPQNVSSFLPVQ